MGAAAERAQEQLRGAGKTVRVSGRDRVDVLAGGDDVGRHAAELVGTPLAYGAGGRLAQHQVDARELFQVVVEPVLEHGIEQISRGLAEGGARHRRLRIRKRIANPDHQQARRAEVDRRAQGSRLAHRAVAEEIVLHAHGGEDERDADRGHHVVEREPAGTAFAARAAPAPHRVVGLEEGDGPPAAEAGRADRDGAQRAEGDGMLHAGEAHVPFQQLAQGAVVEQRDGDVAAEAAAAQRPTPARQVGEQSGPVAAEHLVDGEMTPHPGEAGNAVAEVEGGTRQGHGVEGPGGGARDDREGITIVLLDEFGDAAQHAHLVGAARPATGQHEAGAAALAGRRRRRLAVAVPAMFHPLPLLPAAAESAPRISTKAEPGGPPVTSPTPRCQPPPSPALCRPAEKGHAMQFAKLYRLPRALIAVAVLLVGAAAHALDEGNAAPAFRLQDQNGEWHALADYSGQWVALYFYPKDDTPGCTTEACAFRDDIFKFKEMGVKILGVSLDDVDSHKEFADKYSLPFTLLSDADGATAEAYGVLRRMGPVKMASRQTFLIAPDGRIARHYARVNPDEHSGEVLGALRELMAAAD